MAAEWVHFFELNPGNIESYVTYEGREHWDEAIRLSDGRGILVLTGHFGNFELLSLGHSLHGNRIAIVQRPNRNPIIDRAVAARRLRNGNLDRSRARAPVARSCSSAAAKLDGRGAARPRRAPRRLRRFLFAQSLDQRRPRADRDRQLAPRYCRPSWCARVPAPDIGLRSSRPSRRCVATIATTAVRDYTQQFTSLFEAHGAAPSRSMELDSSALEDAPSRRGAILLRNRGDSLSRRGEV